jgi:hypothetical protein
MNCMLLNFESNIKASILWSFFYQTHEKMKGQVEEHPTFGVSYRLWILLAKSPLKKIKSTMQQKN